MKNYDNTTKRVNKEYGKFFGAMDWNYVATWRPHYCLTVTGSDKRISELTKYKVIDRVLYTLEKDMHPNMVHAHLLLQVNTRLNRRQLAEYLKVNLKQMSYFQPVTNQYKVADYCLKEINRNIVHWNYFD